MTSRNHDLGILKGVLKPVSIGLCIGAITCLIVLMLTAAVATLVDVPFAAVVPLATIASAIGAFVSGIASAKISGRNGWLMGLFCAMLLFVISLIAGLACYRQVDASFLVIKLLILLSCGIAGGVLAVNTKKKKRH